MNMLQVMMTWRCDDIYTHTLDVIIVNISPPHLQLQTLRSVAVSHETRLMTSFVAAASSSTAAAATAAATLFPITSPQSRAVAATSPASTVHDTSATLFDVFGS